jgi:predicted RNA polymerase sigma factor
MADYDGNLKAALDYSQKSVKSNPESAFAHCFRAGLLARMGKLKEARDEFRAGLRYEPQPSMAKVARRAIVQINEEIGVEQIDTELKED